MRLKSGKLIGFTPSYVQYDDAVYPIETFSKARILFKIVDDIKTLTEKHKVLTLCWDYYLPIAHHKASKHHAGCRYAVKQRDKKNHEYGIYKKILQTIKKIQMEIGFEGRCRKYD